MSQVAISVKAVLLDPERRVVLLKNGRGEWGLPGGRLEAGEQPPQVVEREIAEELGIRARCGPILDSWLFEVVPGREVLIVTYLATASSFAGLRQSEEHEAVGWFTAGEMEALPMPEGYRASVRHALARMLDALRHGEEDEAYPRRPPPRRLTTATRTTKMTLRHLNPEGMHRNPAYTQAIVVPKGTATVHVGGQNAVDASGKVVGVGDIGAQSEQVFRNIQTALEAAGTGLEHLIRCNVYIVAGQPIGPGFEAWQRAWGGRPNPPLVSVLFVSGLAHPDYLVEVEAVAAIPES